MKKLNVAFTVDIDDRNSVRDIIIKLRNVINKLNEKWKKLESK